MRQLKISNRITNRESIALERYLNEISKIDVLTPDQEAELARKIRSGDQEALEILIKANLRFVVSVAKQYQNNGLTLNDLINEGNVGLLKAAKRFDETKGFKFITFAVWWIRQSILQAIIENSRMIRLPYNKHHSQKQIHNTYQSFLQEFEREPTAEEISEIFGMKAEDVFSILSSGRHVSLDAPLDGVEGGFDILDSFIDPNSEEPDIQLMKDSISEELKIAMIRLSPREREIITALFGLETGTPKAMEEVGQMFDLSIERVRQLKDHALRILKRVFIKNNFKPFQK